MLNTKTQDEKQLMKDAMALIKTGKEIPYLNLILQLNQIEPKELVEKEVKFSKIPDAKTYTVTVGEKRFQLAPFIVSLMARDYNESTIK